MTKTTLTGLIELAITHVSHFIMKFLKPFLAFIVSKYYGYNTTSFQNSVVKNMS